MNQVTNTQLRNERYAALRHSALPAASSSCPPCVLLEEAGSYSIVFNLLGINPKDILVDVDWSRHELGVYAGKKNETSKSAFFWIFSVPSRGMLNGLKTRYQTGGLEIVIPKKLLATAV